MATASRIFAGGLLREQVAVVTGGGTGLGRATAAELHACGARVAIVGRRAEVLEAAASTIGDRCTAIPGDVREESEAARIVDEVLERHGRLDVLVNNAGGQYFAPAEAIEPKGWQAVFRLNVGGTLTMARAAADRAMRPAGRGTVVNVTLSPHHGLAGMVHSSAARAAVEGLTRELAREWAPDGSAVLAAAAPARAAAAGRQRPRIRACDRPPAMLCPTCGRSVVVAHEPSKLVGRVRFPSPAFIATGRGAAW